MSSVASVCFSTGRRGLQHTVKSLPHPQEESLVLCAGRTSGSLASLDVIVISDRDSPLSRRIETLCCPFASCSFSSSLSPQRPVVSRSLGRGSPVQIWKGKAPPACSLLEEASVSPAWKWPLPTSLQHRSLSLFCPYHVLPLISYLCVHLVSPTRL